MVFWDIKEFSLVHKLNGSKTKIQLNATRADWGDANPPSQKIDLDVALSEGSYVVDILRNTKFVRYDDTQKSFFTQMEKVGGEV